MSGLRSMARNACVSLVLGNASCADDDEPIDDEAGRAALPELEYCDSVRDWDDRFVDREQEMLALIETVRDAGFDCGTGGSFGRAPRPRTTGALVCAARAHALDMATRAFFEHENPDGELVWDRLAHAGYETVHATELITAGTAATEAVLDAWLRRASPCADLLAPEHVDIGVGWIGDVPAPNPEMDEWGGYWTVVLGRPPE